MTVSKDLRGPAPAVIGQGTGAGVALGIRTALGAVACIAIAATATAADNVNGPAETIVWFFIAWIVAVFLTDKYVHKYPQRYVTYLLASHLKAAVTMGVVLLCAVAVPGIGLTATTRLGTAFAVFVVADAILAILWDIFFMVDGSSRSPSGAKKTPSSPNMEALSDAEFESLIQAWPAGADARVSEFVAAHVPAEAMRPGAEGSLFVASVSLNDVRRLSRFLLTCAARVRLGGYLVARYAPLEDLYQEMSRRHSGLMRNAVFGAHFAWHRAMPKIPYLNALYFAITRGRNRALSKTEVWGRLQRCGFQVATETAQDGRRWLIATKIADPVRSARASYYPVIALDRVALNGQIIRAHKVRTMYPFSEYLQKHVFEANSLGTTGKFASDFRITGYGQFLRKYWLDEIPQLYDWWRGDIKLVGLRAMSRHYFSLYPPWFQSLYIQVKPGLIPPLFGETTGGFQEIVDVERRYLESYLKNPARTDVSYLFTTFNDIVFRGVRSH